MNKREFKILSERLNPKIAKAMQKLETEIDNYFTKDRKFKPSEYKFNKKIVQKKLFEKTPAFIKECIKEVADQLRNKANTKT